MAGQKINDVHSRVNFDEDEFLKAYTAKAITVYELDLWAEFAKRWRAFYNDRAAGKTFTFFWPLDAKGLYATAEAYDQERYKLRSYLRNKAPEYVVGFETEPEPGAPGGKAYDWQQIVNVAGAVAITGAVVYLFGPAIRDGAGLLMDKLGGHEPHKTNPVGEFGAWDHALARESGVSTAAQLRALLHEPPRRMHHHVCRCGHAWKHAASSAGNTKKHTCSKCGRESWWRADRP